LRLRCKRDENFDAAGQFGQSGGMKVIAVTCGFLAIGTGLAQAAADPACWLEFSDPAAPALQAEADLPESVARLCADLSRAVAARPALSQRLAQDQAQLLVNVIDVGPTRLSAQLVLRANGVDQAGAPLELQQSDRASLAPSAIARLADHLIDAEPFAGLMPAP